LTFSPNLQLPVGNYWIGLIAGGQTNVALTSYDPEPGVLDRDENAFLAGPSNPFGPISSGDQLTALYLDYLANT